MTFTPPPPSQQVVSALVVQQCVRLAKSRGMATEAFLRGAGLSREQLAASHQQLPFLPLQHQLRAMLDEISDPLIGLRLSALVNLATLGVLGYVVQTSTTLADLIATTIRFDLLLSNVGRTWEGREGNIVLWGWDCFIEDEEVRRATIDCVTGCRAVMLNNLLRRRAGSAVLGVRLPHPQPRDPQLLREYEDFFGCPVQFNQPGASLLLAADALGQTLSLADPELHSRLEEHARLLLDKRAGSVALIDQVRGAVRGQLAQGRAPTREEIAEELGMSGRTLHRRLQDEGTSFRDILDAIRLQMAQDLLRESGLTVEAVAQRLGFQESQSFIRWFRPLAGMTPGEFRQSRG
ncbi:MAG TPA: AraC family transcriptional regulator ligand-binding domain-containing protein, partial [Moraxellaceae bacterium]|nr:AraC family transcriptional regulator ligand-binding domain-containing protein [Moraxellaceae bacterium]